MSTTLPRLTVIGLTVSVVVVAVVHRGIIPTGGSGDFVLQRIRVANLERGFA